MIDVGDRVQAGEPGTEDYDTGRIVAIDHETGMAWVAWDSCVRTQCPISDLRSCDARRAS